MNLVPRCPQVFDKLLRKSVLLSIEIELVGTTINLTPLSPKKSIAFRAVAPVVEARTIFLIPKSSSLSCTSLKVASVFSGPFSSK